MAGNSIGKLFILTTFGESHGTAIGGVIDGCPSNVELNFYQEFLMVKQQVLQLVLQSKMKTKRVKTIPT